MKCENFQIYKDKKLHFICIVTSYNAGNYCGTKFGLADYCIYLIMEKRSREHLTSTSGNPSKR